MSEITGRTRVLMIVADPIEHVRTPQAINALAEARGCTTVMIPCHVGASDLPALFEGLRGMLSLDGLVVTAPHKVAAAALCDELDSSAAQVGAVNAVRRTPEGRWVGGTFDGRGFVRGLMAAGHAVRGRTAFLSGAGGAASAISFALAEEGVARLLIQNRTISKAEELAARVRRAYPQTDASASSDPPGNVDLAINGTSVGMKAGDPLPFAIERLAAGTVVAEVIMQPPVTPLLESALATGCTIHAGQAMLDQQLALIADFLDIRAPSQLGAGRNSPARGQ